MATKATMLRLQREMKELEKEPLEGIQYQISDMKHMCLVLTPQSGPFRGLNLHLKVHIPDDYPRQPPTVTIQTVVRHPNVFSETFICCDILRPRREWSTSGYNGGYTPAYLLKYIFLQLLSFFSVDEVDQDYGTSMAVVDSRYFSEETFRKHAEAAVQIYQCKACGFNDSTVSTSIPSAMELDAVPSESTTDQCALGVLDDDSWLLILDKLSDQDMNLLARAWPPVKRLQQNLVIRRQLVCFYLRKTHLEAVLGIGLKVEGDTGHDSPQSRRPVFVGPRAATVKMLDLLSFEAFTEHGVRTGVYGESINVFLPVTISPSHFRAAEWILKDALMYLHHMWVRPERTARWPLCVVEVLPRLMNNMVLELVKDCDQGNNLRRVKKSSEKALQGYCLLLDLFQHLAKRFPEVEREIRSRVRLFRGSEEGRRKARTPDLGQFLTYLLVLEEDWGAHCVNFTEELLSRNVVWYLDGRKREKASLVHLAHLEDDAYVSRQRLKETFGASAHSLKLMMFQVGFLRLVSRAGIDSHYGYPSAEDSGRMFQLAQEIYAAKDWDACLRICEYPLPESSEPGQVRSSWRPHVCKMLKRAVVYSQEAKYHVMPYSKHQLYYWRWRAEPRCPAPSWWHPRDIDRYALDRLRPGGLSFFPHSR